MSCSEVMYQAYYPYLYQRPGATPAHPVPRAGPFSSPFSSAHQYDRFNMQRLQDSPHPSLTASSSSSVAAVSSRGLNGANSGPSAATAAVVASTGSAASYNTSTPSSPRSHSLPSATANISLQPPLSVPVIPHKEEDSNTCVHGEDSCCSDDGGESPGLNIGPGHRSGGANADASSAGGSTIAQYMSANCVVITHYQGDAAAVVDEHFTKALDKTHNKEISPMSTRNFPASFWNSAHHYNSGNSISGISTSDGLYHQSDGAYHPSDWYHQYSQYHHHHHHQHHHHPMAAAAAAASYGGLLLPPPGSRLHMSAAAAGAAAAQCKAMDWQHAATAATLDNPYTSYPSMTGLEAQVQDSSKDLYWF